MNVRLIHITPDAEKHIAYCARVSNPQNQDNPEFSKLVGYLIRHKHWSPFEMAGSCLEIETSRGIASQILRHRSFSFQEFCISGDSLVTTILPATGAPWYIPIKKLYERQNWKNYANIQARVYDETSGTFTTARIKEVFKTGIKPCYKVHFEDGKTIVCTKEHKFLTETGFESLETAVGLKMSKNTVTMKDPKKLAVNGDLAHQNIDWMRKAKEKSLETKTGVTGIANEAGVSYHTVRKWLKKLGLSFTKKEVASMYKVWNKGRLGYRLPPRTPEQRKRMADQTPKGEKHHAWKGGGASHRKAIANHFNKYRKDILIKFDFTCQMCGTPLAGDKIDLHHIKPVSTHPNLALLISNVIPVHRKCHKAHHSVNYDPAIRSKHKGNTLVPRYTKVVKIDFVGDIETYDLEVDHPSHNYVANKICVHNSQRYSEANEFENYEARRQDVKNKQNSIDDMSLDDRIWFQNAQTDLSLQAHTLYTQALNRGIAKEQARFLLPLATRTRLYMHGSIRSWIHYIEVRSDASTQKEHRDIALQAKDILAKELPCIAKALGWTNEL